MNFEFFSKAVVRLEGLSVRFAKEPEDLMLRDAILHRFEVTYELALKVLRQRLKLDLGSSEAVATASFSELIRLGWVKGLLFEEVAIWRSFRRNRFLAEEESNAAAVCAEIPRFLAEAKFLLSQLEKRNDDDPLD